MKKIILTLFGAVLPLLTFADYDFRYAYEGKTLIYRVIDAEAKTVETRPSGYYSGPGNEVAGVLVIPAVVKDGNDEYTVTQIGEYGFKGCALTSVSIPNTVTNIGQYAFSKCTSLPSVTINAANIEERAFWDCSSLTSVTFTESVRTIGMEAFSGTSLSSIVIPEGVTSLANNCFNSDKLTYAELPNSLTTLGGGAVGYCLQNLKISCKNIGSWFGWTETLKKVVIGEGVESIGEKAFLGCSALTSLTIPNTVTGIGESAFQSCSSLPSVTIPDGVTSIGFRAFSGCSALTSVSIPGSVKTIDVEAFSGTSLSSIVLPEGVTSLGNNCFNSDKLTYAELPNSLTTLGGGSLGYSLTNLKISSSEIGPSWFKWMTSLKEVVLGEGVSTIGSEAFSGCSGITSLSLPNTVTSIEDYAFCGCNIPSVTIPENVSYMGKNCFADCTSLKTVVSKMENVIEGSFFNGIPIKEATLYVPANALETYKTTHQWSQFFKILTLDELPGNGVNEIFSDASASFDVYNLHGILVKENCNREDLRYLSPDTYILRHGNETLKIILP